MASSALRKVLDFPSSTPFKTLTHQHVIDPSASHPTIPVSLLTRENPLHTLVQRPSILLTCHDETYTSDTHTCIVTFVNSPCMHVQCKLILQLSVAYVAQCKAFGSALISNRTSVNQLNYQITHASRTFQMPLLDHT